MALEEAEPQSQGYEFSALENQKFTRLAGAMQLVALLEMAGALLAVYLAAPAAWHALAARRPLATLLPIASVLVPLLVGGWTFRAGAHLRLIVRTQGDDIRHLMDAVGQLTKLYLLQLWLFVVALGFIAFSVIAHNAFVRLY